MQTTKVNEKCLSSDNIWCLVHKDSGCRIATNISNVLHANEIYLKTAATRHKTDANARRITDSANVVKAGLIPHEQNKVTQLRREIICKTAKNRDYRSAKAKPSYWNRVAAYATVAPYAIIQNFNTIQKDTHEV